MPADSPLRRDRPERRTANGAPLRRKPKQLEEEPTVYDATNGAGGGPVLRATGRSGRSATRPARGSSAAGFTDERGSLVVAEQDAAVDPVVRARARQIAARLAVRRPRRDATSRRGIGELGSLPYRGGSDEIDLDRTIEVLTERPVPEDEDIVVRDRVRTMRSVVLAVDVSGSMKGERVATAAATVGALAGELQHDELAVIAFWSDAAVLLNLGEPVKPMDLLDTILRIPAQGLTNVAFPLELAAQQLARAPVKDARVVLLSDCVHNAGPDPRPVAARLPRLDVLLDASGERDVELGRDLARVGRGTLHVVQDFRGVAPAVTEMFSR
ncbi:vWA domain-containing protein [Agromyces aerolatus]|uniref:vWA domain-containing protein n=1 Tax=Agromyces sp. LY-1074 TaxID=3074080 RepID=UPI00285A025E|nr:MULTISPECIES: VWA domain-containing protein [unclassified Agromyces]MDR5700461.1 VWA domain-containing protein [Agromyces sp. LY-1074]MDR5706982.1 VWA domain-containing protein [Agromyces sp. LY-1358]